MQAESNIARYIVKCTDNITYIHLIFISHLMEKKDKDMKKILLSLLLVVTLAIPLPAFAETTGAESQTGAEAQTEAPSGTSADSEKWTSEDFTYTDMSKTIYGCDYTRTVNIEGKAISGFSAKGEAKLPRTRSSCCHQG